MAINPQNQRAIQDTATYIQDTLQSVAANLGETFKEAITSAFTPADATVMKVAARDFAKEMQSAAKASEDLVRNQSRISQGLVTSVDLEKQAQKQAERRLALERQYNYVKQLLGKELTDLEKQMYSDALRALDVQDRQLASDRATVKEIESKIGLTGKLAGALSKIPGLGGLINAKEIDQELRASAATSMSLGKSVSKTGLMMKGLGMAAKQVGKGLMDPLTVLSKVLNAFLEVNKASVEFQRLTGQNASAVGSMNTRFATTVDFLKTASELTQQIGFNAVSIFGPQQLAALAEAKNLLGLSGQEAENLALQSKVSGNTVDSFQDSLLAGVSATNKLRKSAVAPGVVLKDVLNTSKGISASLGNNPERLGKAATAARAFGMELRQVDAIASSLLDFESSIEAELEAQLLTGKEINLAKAREYAMTNNLAGLSEELAKNGATAAEFANMNRFAQESLAKAVGMSRDDLAKSILLQETSKNLTDEQRASVLGVTKEQLQQVDIQERLSKSMDKLAQAFAPILEVLVPIVNLISDGLNILTVMTYPINKLLTWADSFGKGISFIVKGLVAAAAAALFLSGSLTAGLAVAATLAAVGGAMALLKQNTSTINDGVINPDGGLVVSGPKGSIKLNEQDSIVAGTNLFDSGTGGNSTSSVNMQPLIAEIQAMKQELKAVLTTIANKEGNVYLDTDVVGKALVLGSTRM